jgi:peptidoglycan/xylan/chitin deacetylase (PgdA/CDA1 family)
MEWLARSGRPVAPLDRIRETPGGVALTFDDGFRNFYQHAFPVLRKHKFPATVFVVSDYCGGRNNWPTQARDAGIPLLELMRWSEVEEVSRHGVTIGCHTATHPPLTRLSEAELEDELASSQAAIQDRIGRAVDTFAYPYGINGLQVEAAVRRHFKWACSTRFATVLPQANPLDLPRLDVYYFRDRFWFESLGKLYGAGYLAVRALVREAGRRLRGQAA